MEYYIKSVIPVIESNYNKFTMVEKTIADLFINNQKENLIFLQSRWQQSFLFQKLPCHDLPRSVDIGAIENLFTSMKKALSKRKNL